MPAYFSQDAFEDYRYCPTCNGTGRDQDGPCPSCHGRGVEEVMICTVCHEPVSVCTCLDPRLLPHWCDLPYQEGEPCPLDPVDFQDGRSVSPTMCAGAKCRWMRVHFVPRYCPSCGDKVENCECNRRYVERPILRLPDCPKHAVA